MKGVKVIDNFWKLLYEVLILT